MIEKSLYTDELNLFDLIDIILQKKWLIAAFGVLSFMVCLGYVQLTPVKYRVSVPYTVNAYTAENLQICDTNVQQYECLDKRVSLALLAKLDRGWVKDRAINRLYLVTSNPLSIAQYEANFTTIAENATEAALTNAVADLALINNERDNAFLSTEYFAINKLTSGRLVASIGAGQSILEFDKPAVTQIPSNAKFLLVVSIVLGCVFGSFLVIMHNAYRKHKALTAA